MVDLLIRKGKKGKMNLEMFGGGGGKKSPKRDFQLFAEEFSNIFAN